MITIKNTFSGPTGSGHGGVSAGRFAAELEPDGAIVRFSRPIPLGRPLRPLMTDAGLDILDGSTVIATVCDLPGPLSVGNFPNVSLADAATAELRWLDGREGVHMAPDCFACGYERSSDGLHLRPGPVDGEDIYATRWTPPGPGHIPSWMVWAAIDCPTGFPALNILPCDEAALTGQLAVQILRPLSGGQQYTIVSRLVSKDGRRIVTEAAILDDRGSRAAVAVATWISVSLAHIENLALAV